MKFEDYLEQIINNIDEQKTKGIARRAIDVGFEKLTDAQRYVLTEGVSEFIMKVCPVCGEEIEFEDMQLAIFNGKCSSCQHQWGQMEDE